MALGQAQPQDVALAGDGGDRFARLDDLGVGDVDLEHATGLGCQHVPLALALLDDGSLGLERGKLAARHVELGLGRVQRGLADRAALAQGRHALALQLRHPHLGAGGLDTALDRGGLEPKLGVDDSRDSLAGRHGVALVDRKSLDGPRDPRARERFVGARDLAEDGFPVGEDARLHGEGLRQCVRIDKGGCQHATERHRDKEPHSDLSSGGRKARLYSELLRPLPCWNRIRCRLRKCFSGVRGLFSLTRVKRSVLLSISHCVVYKTFRLAGDDGLARLPAYGSPRISTPGAHYGLALFAISGDFDGEPARLQGCSTAPREAAGKKSREKAYINFENGSQSPRGLPGRGPTGIYASGGAEGCRKRSTDW